MGGVVSPGVEGPGVGNSLGEGRRNRNGEVVGLTEDYLSQCVDHGILRLRPGGCRYRGDGGADAGFQGDQEGRRDLGPVR